MGGAEDGDDGDEDEDEGRREKRERARARTSHGPPPGRGHGGTEAGHRIPQGVWENFPEEVPLNCALRDQGTLARSRRAWRRAFPRGAMGQCRGLRASETVQRPQDVPGGVAGAVVLARERS